MGTNDARRIIWAIGKCFFILFCIFLILTKVLLYTQVLFMRYTTERAVMMKTGPIVNFFMF